MCLYEDDDGSVWFGTDGGGVYVLDSVTKKITRKITKDDGLAGENIPWIARIIGVADAMIKLIESDIHYVMHE